MDVIAILGLLEKGLRLIPTLVDAGSSVVGIVNKMVTVAEKAKKGEQVTTTELEELEAELDAKLDEFNAPLPPE